MFCSPLRKRTDARVTLCALCAIGCRRAELGQSPTALASWAVRSKAGNVKTKQSFFIYCSTSKFQSHLFVLNTQYNSNFLEVFKGNSMEKGNHMIRIWFAHGLAANWLLQLCFPYEYVSLVPYEWWKIILDPLECTDCAYELPDSKKCLLFGETFICASSEVVLCNASIACGAIAQSSPQTVPECVCMCVCVFFWGGMISMTSIYKYVFFMFVDCCFKPYFQEVAATWGRNAHLSCIRHRSPSTCAGCCTMLEAQVQGTMLNSELVFNFSATPSKGWCIGWNEFRLRHSFK